MFTDVRLQEVWSLLESGGAEALTLDVFDTLVFRTVPEPPHAFLLLGHRLADAGRLPDTVGAAQFARLRVLAEAQCRAHCKAARDTYEARLEEIWQELLPALPGAESIEGLMAAEVALERDVVRADLSVAELAEMVQTKLGKPVYLVSDTYFSPDQLRGVLRRPELRGIRFTEVFTSSDAGVNKSTGLFDVVIAATGIHPSRIVHLGDNPVADVQGGRDAGLVAVHYPTFTGDPNSGGLQETLRAEGLLGAPTADTPIDPVHGDFGMTALRARTLHRAEAAAVPAGLRRHWESGATVFGPVFAGFGEWVAERARAYGVDHIHCLMREGDFLARVIAEPAADQGLSTSTLWASRQVAALASVYDGTPEELAGFLQRRHPPSIRGLMAQLGVDPKSAAGLAAFADRRPDGPVLAKETLAALCADERVRAEIVLAAGRLRERFLRYLDENLPSSGRILLVDLGWGGTIQALLHRLLRSAGRDVEVVGLYLATNAAAYAHRLAGLKLEGYVASDGEPGRLAAPLMRSPEVLEQLCMPDTGSLVGFAEDLTPLLADDRTPRTQVAQRAAVQAGILAFQREWLRYRRSESGMVSLGSDGARLAALRTLGRFVSRPTAQEAYAFGVWAHDDNFGADTAEGLLPETMLRRMPYLTPQGLDAITMQDLYWPAGVASTSNRPLAVISALAKDAGIPLQDVSPEAAAGPVEVYVDIDGDFLNGDKRTTVPRSGRDGLSLVSVRVDGVGVRRLRIDPAGRRGLLRLDWLRLDFHLDNETAPRTVMIDSLAQPSSVVVVGARLVQCNLIEIVSDDPQLVWTPDAATLTWLSATYAIDVELAFAFLAIRADDLALTDGTAGPPPLVRRAARKLARGVGGRP